MASMISVETPKEKVCEKSEFWSKQHFNLKAEQGVAISLFPIPHADTGLGFYSNDDKLHCK